MSAPAHTLSAWAELAGGRIPIPAASSAPCMPWISAKTEARRSTIWIDGAAGRFGETAPAGGLDELVIKARLFAAFRATRAGNKGRMIISLN